MNTKYQIHDSLINALAIHNGISFRQLEKELCNNAPKKKITLAHNQQVTCIRKKLNDEDAPGFVQVTCYAAKKRIAIYILAPMRDA